MKKKCGWAGCKVDYDDIGCKNRMCRWWFDEAKENCSYIDDRFEGVGKNDS